MFGDEPAEPSHGTTGRNRKYGIMPLQRAAGANKLRCPTFTVAMTKSDGDNPVLIA